MVTRLGLYGGSRGPYGDFSGKAQAPPVFSGTIPDLEYDFNTGTHDVDLSAYFTGADSYSISPSVESGWTFNTSTGVLTIDTDDASAFGPYTVTATNGGGSDSSNAFGVTVSQAQATGGFWYAYEQEYARRKDEEDRRKRRKEKAKRLKDKLDRELAEQLQREEAERERKQELIRLTNLARRNQALLNTMMTERVLQVMERALTQGNYSAMEAFERELFKAREEEEFLIQATMLLVNQ